MVTARYVLVLLLLSSSIALVCQQQADAPDLRTQLANIDYRHSSDLGDYMSRCRQVQALLPALESFYKQSGATLERLRAKHRDDPHLLKMANFYTELNELDKRGLELLRQEMWLASKMSTLPKGEQQPFFDREIRPIESQEDILSKQEIQTAVNAKRSGIPLPPDIDKNLSDMR